MKKRCQVKISPNCLGLTEKWETVGDVTRCFPCGRAIREQYLVSVKKAKMNAPQQIIKKVDRLANLIEQMFLAHRVGDEKKFQEAHEKAAQICIDVIEAMEKQTHK